MCGLNELVIARPSVNFMRKKSKLYSSAQFPQEFSCTTINFTELSTVCDCI